MANAPRCVVRGIYGEELEEELQSQGVDIDQRTFSVPRFGAAKYQGLTDELLLQILGFLEAEELARAALACKPLARLCREDELWPPLCRRAWRAKQNVHAFAGALRAGEARRRVISDCHFAVQLNHFIPGLLSYSVAVFLK